MARITIFKHPYPLLAIYRYNTCRFGGYGMKLLLRLSVVVLNIFVVAFGASLALKASIGVGAWDAVSQAVSTITPIKVGTFAILLNTSTVVVQWILLGKHFHPQRLLQVGVAVLLGVFVNMVYYSLLADVVLASYVLKMAVFLAGILTIAIGVAIILAIDFVTFPLEALCLVISDKTGWNFGKIRQGFDFGSIVVVVILTFIFKIPLFVREGTVIGMLIFGPTIDFVMRKVKPILVNYHLAD